MCEKYDCEKIPWFQISECLHSPADHFLHFLGETPPILSVPLIFQANSYLRKNLVFILLLSLFSHDRFFVVKTSGQVRHQW